MYRLVSLWIILVLFMIFVPYSSAAEDVFVKKLMHPPVKLLDSEGKMVQETGDPISTRKSCGECHNYDFIADGYHSQQGRLELRDWKHRIFPYFLSRGMYGKWCSMPNRQLAALDVVDKKDFDLGTPEWVRSCGTCHVGGGVSEFDRNNRKYTEVSDDDIGPMEPDYHYFSSKKNMVVPWDWKQSGIAEVDCFLCHIRNFNRVARDEQIRDGYFEWAITATLQGTGIVASEFGELTYNPDAFNEDGSVKSSMLRLNEPAPENCGQCHGFVGLGKNENNINPFLSHELLRGTKKFGRVWSSGKIKNSNVNIDGKEQMDFAWDIHAEKKLKCIDCHFSVNNPARKIRESRKVEHLKYLPVDFEWEDYLQNPDHNFTKGHSYPESIREEHECTMRSCNECHAAERVHKWLPYKNHHFRKLGCETCHIPRKNYWAYKQLDMTLSGSPISKVRGLAPGEDPENLQARVVGFQPAYFPRTCKDKIPRITPHNLITSLFWFDSVNKRPAFKRQVTNAFMEYDSMFKLHYKSAVINTFDLNGDGELSDDELRIDSEVKYNFAKKLIAESGVLDPELRMEILPFSLAHNIVSKGQAIKDCSRCHSSQSQLITPVEVFDFQPYNTHIDVAPIVDVVSTMNEFSISNGKVYFESMGFLENYYIIGSSRNPWVEWIGWLAIAGSFAGAVLHGFFRKFPKILDKIFVRKGSSR